MPYGGTHRGTVIDVDHPQKAGYVRCDVEAGGIPGKKFTTGWLEVLCEDISKGDRVAITFEAPANGPERGFVHGKTQIYPSGRPSSLPTVMQREPAGPAPYDRGIVSQAGADFSELGGPEAETFKEPASFAAPVYPHNRAVQYGNGVLYERDKTPGKERYHRRLGRNYVEVDRNNNEARRVGRLFHFIETGVKRLVGDSGILEIVTGPVRKTWHGLAALSVGGALFAKVAGGVQALIGDVKVVISQRTDPADPESVASLQVQGPGNMELVAGSEAVLSGATAARVVSAGSAYVSAIDDVKIVAAGGDVDMAVAGKLSVKNVLLPIAPALPVFLITEAGLASLLSHTHVVAGVMTGEAAITSAPSIGLASMVAKVSSTIEGQ